MSRALDDGKEGSIFPPGFSHQGRRVPEVLVLDDLGGQQGRTGLRSRLKFGASKHQQHSPLQSLV